MLHRVRLFAQLKRWSEAERELNAYRALIRSAEVDGHLRTSQNGSYYFHATEHMLRGLIREEQGDAAGAAAVFKAGTRRAFLESLPPEERSWRAADADSNTIRDNLYMSTRSGTLTDAEAIEERDSIGKLFSDSKHFGGIATLVPLPPAALRTMWMLPSSRTAMRAIHFREAGYAETTLLPIRQLGVAVFHVEAVTDLTPANEAVLNRAAARLIELM